MARRTRTSPLETCADCCSASASASGYVATTSFFSKDGVDEILNLQPKGAQAKPYQVKQVRGVIVKYKLSGGERAG